MSTQENSESLPKIKYDRIGTNYNSTRKADPYLLSRILYHLNPVANGYYLDIGCGTGNYTMAIHELGFTVTGVDPSENMLGVAREKFPAIEWINGYAESIPCKDNFFDGIIATLTIHHWTNLVAAFRELFRVLKRDGKIVIFTSTPDQMKSYWVNHYFPIMMRKSTNEMPSQEVVNKAAGEAGLEIVATEKYFVHDDLQDLFLQAGKNRPEIYFDESVRSGISTFASLANAAEVKLGLENLKKDIASDNFEAIRKDFENNEGDYIFLILKKSN